MRRAAWGGVSVILGLNQEEGGRGEGAWEECGGEGRRGGKGEGGEVVGNKAMR